MSRRVLLRVVALACSVLAVTVGLSGATALSTRSPVFADVTCRAMNLTRDQGPTSSLQYLLDRAHHGDVIEVSGTCAGGFVVRKSVDLVGMPTTTQPHPTLTGRDTARVLLIRNDHARRVVVEDLTIAHGFSNGHGGGILNRSGGDLIVRDSVVTRNVATKGGGVFTRGCGDLRVIRTTVTANEATRGAGVYFFRGKAFIDDSTLTDNRAEILGGALLVRHGSAWMYGHTVVTGNTARRGGALFNRDGSLGVGGRSRLSENRAGRGGAIYTLSHLTIDGHSRLVHNRARSNGGAVFSYAPGHVLVDDHAAVNDNRALISGGGVLLWGGRLTVGRFAVMKGNTARNGGAIASLEDVGRVVLRQNARVVGNTATNGGALSFGGPTFIQGSVVVEENQAVNGGALWDSCRTLCHGGFVEVGGSAVIRSNSSTEAGGGINSGRGGVIVGGHAAVVANISGTNGGGIYDASGGEIDRTGDVVVEDHARVASNTAAGNGGGIWSSFSGGRVLLLDAGTVRHNHAVDGGGIYGELVRMFGSSVVSGNTADGRGGGVAAFGGGGRTRISGSSVIETNSAAVAGGGIYTWGGVTRGGDLWLERSATVRGNQAGLAGGVHIDEGWELSLGDAASVTGNRSTTEGGGIYSLGTVIFLDGWLGTVCGNDPDDWPSCSAG